MRTAPSIDEGKSYGKEKLNSTEKIWKGFEEMNENENFVPEGTENVDAVATEEITGQVEQIETPEEKLYSEAEMNAKVDELLAKKLGRATAKIEKEYKRKYEDLETVLKAGSGKTDVGEIANDLRDFYAKQGVEIPSKPTYSDDDIKVLANADASEIINAGYEEVVEEVDRMAKIGVKNMSARDKATFKILAEYRQDAERINELSALGVKADVYDSKEFKDFSAKFSANTPVKDIYEIYNKMQPKKEIKTMGSVTHTAPNDTGVKDFYTAEEARKFTKADFDKNPELFKAVERSMLKW